MLELLHDPVVTVQPGVLGAIANLCPGDVFFNVGWSPSVRAMCVWNVTVPPGHGRTYIEHNVGYLCENRLLQQFFFSHTEVFFPWGR